MIRSVCIKCVGTSAFTLVDHMVIDLVTFINIIISHIGPFYQCDKEVKIHHDHNRYPMYEIKH